MHSTVFEKKTLEKHFQYSLN